MDATSPLALKELEEPVNRFLHIPLAGRLVAGLKSTPVTPNQVTGTAVLVGLGAAVLFSRGTPGSLFWGGVLLEITLIMDCVDGQLARATGRVTEWGRVLDGAADYVIKLAAVTGLALGLPAQAGILATIAVLTVIRALAYDYCKQVFTRRVQTGIDGSLQDLQETWEKIRSRRSAVATIYFYYLQVQRFLFRGRWTGLHGFSREASPQPGDAPWSPEQRARFHQKIKPLLAIWKWSGPDLVVFLFVVSVLLGVLEFILMPLAVVLGLQLPFTLMVHHRILSHEKPA